MTYGDRFSAEWGGKARKLLEEFGPSVFGVTVDPSSRARDNWNLASPHKGGMITAGAQGGITGRGFHLIVYDDPIKNAEEARSEVIREKIWDTFVSTINTRLEPGGAIVILMARWHQDDLVGRIVAQPSRWEHDPWTIIDIPALAREGDPLGRQPGEALWPERYPRHVLEGIRQINRYWFSALYQQSPTPDEGIMFKRADMRYYTLRDGTIGDRYFVLADGEREAHFDTGLCPRFQTVDVAASDKKTSDYTVVSTWARTADADLLLLDVDRQHFETMQVGQFLKRCADKHQRPPMYIETFGAGKVPYLQLSRDGYPVRQLKREEGTTVDKTARAMPAVFAYERHKVFHPADAPAWLDDYEQELVDFGPGAAHDDQVDCVAYAARILPRFGMEDYESVIVRPPPVVSPMRGILTETF
jgi:predicted phage terminase large subunit-like protein